MLLLGTECCGGGDGSWNDIELALGLFADDVLSNLLRGEDDDDCVTGRELDIIIVGELP